MRRLKPAQGRLKTPPGSASPADAGGRNGSSIHAHLSFPFGCHARRRDAGAPLGSSAAAASCDGRPATIVGTAGDDVLVGRKASDVIYGGGGNDRISGGPNGNDRRRRQPEQLDLREVVAQLENLLHRALGERVELATSFSDELYTVEADPGQIEQVLVNLAVNARDAMPDGGRLLIEVENVELDEEYTYMHPDTEAGSYVRLKVSDTGIGMEHETIQRAFEPFFTTKGKGEGTGLGLATVYGIVTGAGGRVDIYSEPGMGTTIKVHLPASLAAPSQSKARAGERPGGNGEVVLVVEDEADVRRMAERTSQDQVQGPGQGGQEGRPFRRICRRTDRGIQASAPESRRGMAKQNSPLETLLEGLTAQR